MLWIPHQLVGAPLGSSVTLECYTEAHPTSLNYWTREDGNMIHESTKYHSENSVGPPAYKTHMRLTIHRVAKLDEGTYKCVAKNPRGETDGNIRLYSKLPHKYIKYLIGWADEGERKRATERTAGAHPTEKRAPRRHGLASDSFLMPVL